MVSNRAISFIKSISYTVSVNIFSLAVSLLTVIILPKVIGVTEYSYWQLYLFYSSYIVFISLGWCDGIYLRFGGYEYDDLPKRELNTQFYSMAVYLFFSISIILTFIFINDFENNKKYVLISTCFGGLIYICRIFFQYILQATNKIKEYAKLMLFDRILFCVCLLAYFFTADIEFEKLIIIDILVKLITLIYVMFECKDIIFSKLKSLNNAKTESIKNITVGIKLALANLAGILIVGIVQLGIELNWSVEVFGKISFTLSLNNMMLVFINAIGLVIFPLLCRASIDKLPELYKYSVTLLSVPLLGIISFYYPIKLVLSLWLPNYSDALDYMALLFPICFFESKMSLIINTYMKVLRKEKILLYINLVVVIMSIITSTLVFILLHNLTLAVISITFLLAIRCILAELILSKILKVSYNKNMLLENLLCFIFIFLSWFIDSWFSVIIYLGLYTLLVYFNKKHIIETVKSVRFFIRN